MKVKNHSGVSDSVWPHGLYSPWNFPGQNTGVGSLSLLQGIFPNQGLNQDLLHCRRILYQLNYQGSPFWYECWLVKEYKDLHGWWLIESFWQKEYILWWFFTRPRTSIFLTQVQFILCTPVSLPGRLHGQRSLAGYSPWGCKSQIWLTEHTRTHARIVEV